MIDAIMVESQDLRIDFVRGMQNSIQIACLHPNDIEAAFRLAYSEGWNQTRSDWLRLLGHQPKGCFGAYSDDRLVGTVTTSLYGTDLAWVGMMLVQSEYRGLGIGRKLMMAALEYAQTGVTTIKLDATPAGRTLYEALGFLPESGIERWERGGIPPETDPKPAAVQEANIAQLCKIDFIGFGADRAKMLESLSQQSSAQPLVASNQDGTASGYAMARPGSRAMYVGPIVSIDPHVASVLFDRMVDQFGGRAIYVDLYKGSATASTLLSARGFAKQRDLTRMYWGKPSRAGLSPFIFSIGGPEIG